MLCEGVKGGNAFKHVTVLLFELGFEEQYLHITNFFLERLI